MKFEKWVYLVTALLAGICVFKAGLQTVRSLYDFKERILIRGNPQWSQVEAVTREGSSPVPMVQKWIS